MDESSDGFGPGGGRDDGRGVPGQGLPTLVEGGAAGPVPAGGLPLTTLPPGDRYVLTGRLGEGGIAVVHEARDLALDRTVALKVLRREHLGEEEHRARFAGEVRIMSGLEHPGTVPLYDAGELPGGEPFYAMKRVRGDTLRGLLAARGPERVGSRHDLAHFVGIFERVCEAVAYAHAVSLVHRDLKPENVMVDAFGAVYVMDWGLAKRIGAEAPSDGAFRTQLGAVMGTPAYMPPEQARGMASDSGCEADVFSLGVMLYEILTGVLPFSGATYAELTQRILHEDPLDVRRRNPRAPRQLAAVCLKALDKNPLRRYRTAGELAADVRRYREFLPVTAARPTAGERVTNWARRRPLRAGTAAALLLAGVVGGAVLAFQAAMERRVITQGLGKVEELRADLDRTDAAIAELERAIDAGIANPTERRAAEQQLAEMQARHSLDEELFRSTVGGLAGYTFMSTDEQVQAMAKQRIMKSVEQRISDREYAQAKVSIEWLLGSDRRGNPFGLDDEDRARLKTLLGEASKGLPKDHPGRDTVHKR